MAGADEYPQIADQGSAFTLRANYKDDAGDPVDLSAGWMARFIAKESFDSDAAFANYTNSDAQVTLSDGSDGYNIEVVIDAATTAGWPCIAEGRYELKFWPLSFTQLTETVLRGTLQVRRGLGDS
jgi:hypothetical protein